MRNIILKICISNHVTFYNYLFDNSIGISEVFALKLHFFKNKTK